MSDITPTQELDCKGMNCPLPVLKTIQRMKPGEILMVVATDPGSVADMAAFSRSTGHEILKKNEDHGVYTFYLQR